MLEGKYLNYEEFAIGLEMIELELPERKELLSIDEILKVCSMCCITAEDHVLLAMKEVTKILLAISYLYMPSCLEVLLHSQDNETYRLFHEKVNMFSAVCEEYQRTFPKLKNQALETTNSEESRYDVIVWSDYDTNLLADVQLNSRFEMLLGDDFEIFQHVIRQSSKRLKNNGRLIVLARICWILPIWQLFEECHLQFEYLDYRLYVTQPPNHNEAVWLRFRYREENIDLENQKRNLYRYMKDNQMDQLFAHKNHMLYPYIELPKKQQDAYVEMNQNLEDLQYFFTKETTSHLAELCVGHTACLVVPSVALCAYDTGKEVVLFEKDNRFRVNGGVKYVKYDLYKGLNPVNYRKYVNKFQTLICDPPFNVNLSVLAEDIAELVEHSANSTIYIIYPKSRAALLCNAMLRWKMKIQVAGLFPIEYARPPKLVRYEGVDAIQIYQFRFITK